jgi:hypothetical protein
MLTSLHARLLLTSALEDQGKGALFAGAFVDVDHTATVELLERRDDGWWNLTTNEPTTSLGMAEKYDDVVITRLADG